MTGWIFFQCMIMIQPLFQTELPEIETLLKSFDLPVSDLKTAPIQFFGIKKDGILTATGALEIYNSDAILRSVAVHRNYQNLGLGKQITHFLENKAVEMGVQHLYLLTVTAEHFFKKLNYLEINRNSCPVAILSSTEFAEICPSSATCLRKVLRS